MAKIAVILGRLVVGGSTIDTIQTLQYLQKTHNLILICGSNDRSELVAEYLIEQLGQVKHFRINGFSSKISPVNDFFTFLQIRRILKTHRPDIVHTHSAKAGLLGRLAAFSVGIKNIVHTYHGLVTKGYFNPLVEKVIIAIERWLAKRTTISIALSATQHTEITKTYRLCAAESVQVIPIGIEFEKYMHQKDAHRLQFRSTYGVGEGEVTIGLVGRIVPIKNHAFFLKAISLLIQQHSHLRFFIIGDGPQRKPLQHQAQQLGISNTYFPETLTNAPLTFTSWIKNIEVAMAGLDVVVLTSLSEGTPLSLIEAQAAGKPVVATKTGGVEDIVLHNNTGYIVEQGQLHEFVQSLNLLINDEGLRNRMGEMGHNYVVHTFEKTKQVAATDALYQKLVS